MIKVRNAKYNRNERSISVKASITCSGTPPNCNRVLHVRFRIVSLSNSSLEIEKTIYIVDSSPFTIFHHRRKRDLNPETSTSKKRKENSENAVVVTTNVITNPHQLLRPFFQVWKPLGNIINCFRHFLYQLKKLWDLLHL